MRERLAQALPAAHPHPMRNPSLTRCLSSSSAFTHQGAVPSATTSPPTHPSLSVCHPPAHRSTLPSGHTVPLHREAGVPGREAGDHALGQAGGRGAGT